VTDSPGFLESVRLVAVREVLMKLRSKAFLISTGILMLGVLASVLTGSILSAHPPATSVAATGSAVAVAQQAPGLKVRAVDSVREATSLVEKGDVKAAIVPGGSASPLGVTIIALDAPPQDVIARLSVAPPVELLHAGGANPMLAYLVAIGFGLVFFLSAITFGTTIAQSVVEEKQTRVVELLMSAIPVRSLMAGKVLGNSLLAFAQIAAIVLLAAAGLAATGQQSLLSSLGPSLVWFVVFFVFGFVMLAALYAATASLVSRQEDVGSVTSPVMVLIMLPYFLVIFFNDNPLVLGIMSYVPFSAPVGMPMRIFLGDAAWWEPLASLALLLLVTTLVIALGSRIYANSLLRTGARVKLKDALSGR
jgi:ABC-2 type transport system permease protein